MTESKQITAPVVRARPPRRARPQQRAVSQRNKANRANIALPLSVIKVEEPVRMKAGDWIGLAGLVTIVIGFAVATRELIRIARASEAEEAAHRTASAEAGAAAGELVSPEPAGRAG